MFANSVIYTQTYLYNDFLKMIIKDKQIYFMRQEWKHSGEGGVENSIHRNVKNT